MENHQNSILGQQAYELFSFYDRSGIGVISKAALLHYFGCIDRLITEKWLSKMLLPRGISLKDYINYEEFVKIIQTLSLASEQQENTEYEN